MESLAPFWIFQQFILKIPNMTSLFSHQFWETYPVCVYVMLHKFSHNDSYGRYGYLYVFRFSIADLLYRGTVVKYFIPTTSCIILVLLSKGF